MTLEQMRLDWTDLKWSSGCFTGMGIVALDTSMIVGLIEMALGAVLYVVSASMLKRKDGSYMESRKRIGTLDWLKDALKALEEESGSEER